MKTPDFLILGAQKAGTTWLAARLSDHPDIFMPRNEVHYFDVPGNFAKGPHWYSQHFEGAEPGQILGEKTPDYLWTNRPQGNGCPEMVGEIHKLASAAKLIVVLRDPVRRAISALNHHVAVGRLSPFTDVDALLTGSQKQSGQQMGLIERGFYAEQVRQFQALYGDDAIRVLVYEEDIVQHPTETLESLLGFLQLDAKDLSANITNTENRGLKSRAALIANYYAPIAAPVISALDRLLPAGNPIRPSDSAIRALYDLFVEPNRDLENLLGRDLSCWQQP